MRNRTLSAAVVIATAGALALTACSSSKKSNTGGLNGGGGTTGGSSQTYKIGFIGALSGPNAQLGINERNGAQLAVDQANSSGKNHFTITLDPQDSEGDPAKAPAAATALISDPSVIATVGPAFSGESKAVDPTFCGATPPMPIVTASASNGTLQDQGYKCWHRIIPNDNVEGTQGADWLARTGSKKVFVLDDKSTYGAGVAATMATELKAKGVTVVTGSVDGTSTKNYNPIAGTIASSGADAMFYGGYDAQAALLAKALVTAGFHGRTVTGNGGKSSIFTSNAGPAGNGWYFTCGCQDATTAPAAQAFAAAYQTKFNTPPSTYSPEAYDATNLIIDAISKVSGTATRTNVLTQLNTEDFQGITTEIKFQSNGELASSSLVVNLFKQTGRRHQGAG